MKDFLIVFKFELLNQLKKKSVIVTTLVLALIAFALTSIPTIMKMFEGNNDTEKQEQGDNESQNQDSLSLDKAIYYVVNPEDKEKLTEALGIKDNQLYESEQTIKDELLKEKSPYKIGFVINSLSDYKTIYKDRSLDAYEPQMIKQVLTQISIQDKIKEYNISLEQYKDIQNAEITETQEILGKDASSNMFLAYAMIIIMYMIINLYGATTSTNIAREKDSRTMELLITSVKPSALIVGKVAAMGVAALIQIGIIIIGAVIGFMLSKHNYPEMLLTVMRSSITWDTVLIYFVFFVLGYILYLFIYASMGSVVSKVEDVGSATGPITFIFLIGYMLAFMAMAAPDTLVAKIASWVPFTSLMVMPTRYPLVTIPFWEMALSIGLLVLTAIFFAYLSIKIYRMGSLNYGNKVSLFKAIKMALSKES